MRVAIAILTLIRPYTTGLTFLSLLVPLLARSGDVKLSLCWAAPAAFVSICTFLLNDLDDIDKDKINHPDRPLPRGTISPPLVVALYYTCLATALLSIRFAIALQSAAFLYYVLLTVSISYGYIVDYLPAIKAPYVAAASALPILIVHAFYPNERALYLTAAAASAFMLGRELCKDVLDRPGDPPSTLHAIHPRRIAHIALASQVLAIVIVAFEVRTVLDAAVVALAVAFVAYSYRAWFSQHRYHAALVTMKAALYTGLYFLVTVR